MKHMIGIHGRKGSFSEDWIKYCENNQISYKLINCYSMDIINQVSDCTHILWHWWTNSPKDNICAISLIDTFTRMGIKVFPDFNTCIHFDNKVHQKYLFDLYKIPSPKTTIFYDKNEALKAIDNFDFPLIAKLKGGAGSRSVKKIKNTIDARVYIKKAFGNGFVLQQKESLKDTLKRLKKDKSLRTLVRVVCRILFPFHITWEVRDAFAKYQERRKDNHFYANLKSMFLLLKMAFVKSFSKKKYDNGYVYFQEYIENNYSDVRVVVIGNKAVAIKRLVRENDFRASGSGSIVYSHSEIPKECILLGFEITRKLNMQSCALDFVFDYNKDSYTCLEVSYGFSWKAYEKCDGHWTEDANWHSESINLQEEMIRNLLSE